MMMMMVARHRGYTPVHPCSGIDVAKQHRGGRQALRGHGEEQQPEEELFESAAHGFGRSPGNAMNLFYDVSCHVTA